MWIYQIGLHCAVGVNPQWLSQSRETKNWVGAQSIKLGASGVPV